MGSKTCNQNIKKFNNFIPSHMVYIQAWLNILVDDLEQHHKIEK
jgi:hypothetical protein